MAEMNTMVKAFNDAIAKSGIQIEMYRNDFCDEWKVKVDTSKHDAEIRADAIDELADAMCCSSAFTNMQKDAIRDYAEQLKEQK